MILIGTDFSAGARAAHREGTVLAQALGQSIVLVHVLPRVGGTLGADARTWLRAARVDERALVLRHGTPWIELLRHATDEGATMVVIGSHGRSGYQGITTGSTTGRLILRSPVPVVIAPFPREPETQLAVAAPNSTQKGNDS